MIRVTHQGHDIDRASAARLVNTTPAKLSRRLARMLRRNPKLTAVSIDRLLILSRKHTKA